MESLTLGSGRDITFSGGPGDYFVLNISGKMALSGDASIGGVSGSHVLVNLYNNTGPMGTAAQVDNLINGTILAPYDDPRPWDKGPSMWLLMGNRDERAGSCATNANL
ncbi:MAG: hypothetical protein M1608_02900 [Candidatus Omnitrophica bacterium]|nr:hypothetical protein [Candidatus Omnitrophota bacterium]